MPGRKLQDAPRAFVVMAGLAMLTGLAGPAFAGDLATAFRSGDLARAERLARLTPSGEDPEDAAARCRLQLFQNQGQAAAACFRRRLAADPADKAALAGLAFAAWRTDDFAAAAEAYTRAGRAAREAEARALAALPTYRIASRKRRYAAPFARTDPLPLLPVRLADGVDRLFLLDTGAAETLLDPDVAKQIGVTALDGAATGVFAGGQTAKVRFGVLPRLTLGDLTLENTPVQLQSTAAFSAVFDGAPVAGVIGVDLLRHFRATIDYPGHRLLLIKPGRTAPPPRDARRFWMADDHLLLTEAQIDGDRELSLIDTGLAGQGCTLPTSTLAAIGQRADGEAVRGVGGGGATAATRFTARAITLGTVRQTDVSCLFGPFPPPLETSTGARIGLLLSHTVLKPYAVTFDFSAMRFWLRRP